MKLLLFALIGMVFFPGGEFRRDRAKRHVRSRIERSGSNHRQDGGKAHEAGHRLQLLP